MIGLLLPNSSDVPSGNENRAETPSLLVETANVGVLRAFCVKSVKRSMRNAHKIDNVRNVRNVQSL